MDVDQHLPLLGNNADVENELLSENHDVDDTAALIESTSAPDHNDLSFYQYFIRLCARTPICFKVFYFLFVQCGHWLRGESVMQPDNSRLRRTVIVQNILRGSDFFIGNIATPIFLALLIRDFVTYVLEPENRYGTIPWDILAGTATNQATWTGDRGFDVVTETNFYLTPVIIFGSWLSTIILYGLCNRSWYPFYFSNDLPLDVATVNPRSWCSSADRAMGLGQAETVLLWQSPSHELMPTLNDDAPENSEPTTSLSVIQRRQLLEKIINKVRVGSLSALPALSALAAITVNFSGDVHDAVENYFVRQSALAALNNAGRWKKLRPLALSHYLKANYLLWSLGQSKKIAAHLIFWMIPLLTFYVKVRFVEGLVFKLIQVWHFFAEQAACLDEGKRWLFMDVTDQYACSFCGDWDFIYYRDQFNAQKCLAGLFAQVTNPQVLANYLNHFPKTQLAALDLSAQDFSVWSTAAWSNLLSSLSHVLIPPLHLLNLSSTSSLPTVWLNTTIVDQLAAFIAQFQVQQLDLANQLMGATLFDQLLAHLPSHFFTMLNVSNNALGDLGAQLLQNHSDCFRQLTALNLDDNAVTDEGVQYVATTFTNSSLSQFSLQNNAFSDVGMQALCTLMRSLLFLRQVDFSGNLFTSLGAQALGAVLPYTTLIALRLSGMNMDDMLLAELIGSINQTSVNTLDFSDNDLTGSGLLLLIQRLQHSLVHTIWLANNDLSTHLNLSECLRKIAYTSIQFLDLSNTGLTAAHINATESLWARTDIRYLNLAQNALTDSGALLLQQALHGWNLIALSLANTEITQQGALALIDALPFSLRTLDLSHNFLSPQVLYRLVQNFLDSTLGIIDLNLEATFIDSDSVQRLASILSIIKLQFLNVAKNILTNSALIHLATHLINQIPQLSTIVDRLITRNEKRALAEAVSKTVLQQLRMDYTQISDDGVRAICRVLPATNFSITDLFLQGNSIDPDQVNIDSCYIAENTDASNHFIPFMRRRALGDGEPNTSFLNSLLNYFFNEDSAQSLNFMSLLPILLLCATMLLLGYTYFCSRSKKSNLVTQESAPPSFWSKINGLHSSTADVTEADAPFYFPHSSAEIL